METITHALEPLLFYLIDNNIYFTSFAGPRYNEYVILLTTKKMVSLQRNTFLYIPHTHQSL